MIERVASGGAERTRERVCRDPDAAIQVEIDYPARCGLRISSASTASRLRNTTARLAEQGGGCAVCGRPPKEGKSLHVDHDHETGYVRGLLCFSCNAALGHFQDDLDRIDAALIYVATKRRVSALRLAR